MRRVMGAGFARAAGTILGQGVRMLPMRSRINLLGEKIQKLGLGCAMRLSGESLSQFIALWPPEHRRSRRHTGRSRIELDGIEEIGGRTIA